jgi:hypothetical protein
MPVIPATQELEIRRTEVGGQPISTNKPNMVANTHYVRDVGRRIMV